MRGAFCPDKMSQLRGLELARRRVRGHWGLTKSNYYLMKKGLSVTHDDVAVRRLGPAVDVITAWRKKEQLLERASGGKF